MAGEAGQPSEPLNLLAGMAAAPWDYDFFQALRRIECESPQLPRLGHSVRLADDPLRLGQKPDCTFAPSTLASVSQAGTAAVPRLDQFFFGLTGPNGRCRCTSPNTPGNASATSTTRPSSASWTSSTTAC